MNTLDASNIRIGSRNGEVAAGMKVLIGGGSRDCEKPDCAAGGEPSQGQSPAR
jgi:hypothetical protein